MNENNHKKKKTLNKILISLIIFVIFSLVLISFSFNIVKAQEQKGCCLNSGTEQCITTTRDKCSGRFYTGPPYDCSNVPECKPQTCIPKDSAEPCLRNKRAAECLSFGVPVPEQMEQIPQCQEGCCIIGKGIKAEVMQKRQCENLTRKLGFDPNSEMMEFRTDVTNQIECKKIGSPSDLGCCSLGAGSCHYENRESCTNENGNFVPLAGGLYCRDVSACALKTHSYVDCGKLPGTETDIYWFDSQGNQEELNKSCGYPNNMCIKNESGAVCKSTTCKINGTAQKMSDHPPKVNTLPINDTLLTGTSICYNFYTHYGDDRMKNRSTGLQNQIIHCSLGKPEIAVLGTDRKKLCVQSTTGSKHGYVIKNNYENCSKCGESKGSFGQVKNMVGDFFGPTFGFPSGSYLASIGGYCDKQRCESGAYGNCTYHRDYGPTENAVGGFGFGLPVPIGSCDPTYPPGDSLQCGSCGGGGDALWNLCSKAECYSKGNCYFQEAGTGRKLLTFFPLSLGLAWAERTPLIIPECTLSAAVCKFSSDPLCKTFNFFKCVNDRFGAYTIAAPVPLLHWLVMDLIWEQGIKSNIWPAIQQVASGTKSVASSK